MDFNNGVVTTIPMFGQLLWITETHVTTWIVMAILIVLAVIARISLKQMAGAPSGTQNIVEFAVEMFDNFVKSIMGEENRIFGAWFFGLFCFIIVSNYSGLLGFRPPTADWSTTLVFSVTTFALVHFNAIVRNPKPYFKGYFEPIFVFLPMNIIGELAIILSLSLRMFGNIMAGMIIMGIIYDLFPIILTIGIPAPLHIYFDVFSGAIQAFIFTMLSMIFIKNKL